ncbi:MAG: ankyrin repeat domain-containing protein [Candidatus Babeliales bacterium]
MKLLYRLSKIFVIAATFFGCYQTGWAAEITNLQPQEQQKAHNMQMVVYKEPQMNPSKAPQLYVDPQTIKVIHQQQKEMALAASLQNEREEKEAAQQKALCKIPKGFIPKLQEKIIEFITGKVDKPEIEKTNQRLNNDDVFLINRTFEAQAGIDAFNSYNNPPVKKSMFLRNSKTGQISRSTTKFPSASLPEALENLLTNAKKPTVTQHSLLHNACSWRCTSMVKGLLGAGLDPNTKRIGDEETPLHAATSFQCPGNNPAVQMLLDAGANPNEPNKAGYTPLAGAVASRNIEIVKTLIEHGADPNRATPNLARVENSDLILPYVRPTVLHIASADRYDTEIVNALLAAHADPNVKDFCGKTPLGEAIENHNAKTVGTLLHNGADPNMIAETRGETPLHLAARENRPDIIELLLRAGANPKAINDDRRTPLYVAEHSISVSNDAQQLLKNAEAASNNNRSSIKQHLGDNFDPYAENIDINQPSGQAIEQPQPPVQQEQNPVVQQNTQPIIETQPVEAQPAPQSSISRITNPIKNNKRTSIAAAGLTVLWGWYLWKKYGSTHNVQELSIDQMDEEKTGFAAWLENHGLEMVALAGSAGIIALCKHLDNKAQSQVDSNIQNEA